MRYDTVRFLFRSIDSGRVGLLGLLLTAAVALGAYADTNVWVAAPPSGDASDSSNWSLNAVPQAGDHILLSSSSTADMVWDAGVNGLSDTVASWTQDSSYTGTVTFSVMYPEAAGASFTNFVVAGDVLIENGAWTHPTNAALQKYRLAVSVGGNFTLGVAAKIETQYKGYATDKFPAGGARGIHGGSRSDPSKTYGTPYAPRDLGAGGYSLAGGGAVWLEVAGGVVVDGLISADSSRSSAQYGKPYGGAGGSVFIKAASVSGGGSVSASSASIDQRTDPGSGGRIAFILTSPATFGLPLDNIKATGSIGSLGSTTPASVSTGAGTILIKSFEQAFGTLYVKNVFRDSTYGHRYPSPFGTTPVKPGETWAFDKVLTAGAGILSVPQGAILQLSDGFGAVSGSGLKSGILYLGGAFDFGSCPAPFVFRSNWVFQAETPYSMTGNVSVVDGGAVGLLQLDNDSSDASRKCEITVNGDMNVDSTSWIYARASGFDYSFTGITDLTAHGGQQGASIAPAYGSILNPVLPGANGAFGDGAVRTPGGGAVILRVSGTLNVDGTAESSGNTGTTNPDWSSRGGSGGSLNITAGRLTGTGTITAPGDRGSYHYNANIGWRGSSGGGRIAVRLNSPGATFDGFGIGKIAAKGKSHTDPQYSNYYSSAGTVYLQDASKAEGEGTIYVRNDGNPNSTVPVTVIPATRFGGPDDDLSRASLVIGDCAKVKLLGTNLKLASVTMEQNTRIDLNGATLKVKGLVTGTQHVSPGTYGSGSSLFTSGYVTDTSVAATGQVIVREGTIVFLF